MPARARLRGGASAAPSALLLLAVLAVLQLLRESAGQPSCTDTPHWKDNIGNCRTYVAKGYCVSVGGVGYVAARHSARSIWANQRNCRGQVACQCGPPRPGPPTQHQLPLSPVVKNVMFSSRNFLCPCGLTSQWCLVRQVHGTALEGGRGQAGDCRVLRVRPDEELHGHAALEGRVWQLQVLRGERLLRVRGWRWVHGAALAGSDGQAGGQSVLRVRPDASRRDSPTPRAGEAILSSVLYPTPTQLIWLTAR